MNHVLTVVAVMPVRSTHPARPTVTHVGDMMGMLKTYQKRCAKEQEKGGL